MWLIHYTVLSMMIGSMITVCLCAKGGSKQVTGTTTTTAPPSKASLIDSFVSAALSCKPSIPGLSLAVVQNGQIVLEQGYGLADIDQNIEATKDTKFGIASITKSFTTALLAKVLSNTNSTNFDTQLRNILGPDFEFLSYLRTRYGTLRDLAAHRMGIPGFSSVRFQSSLERVDLLRILRYLPAKRKFRTSFYYNNLLYGLLAHITEMLANDGTWEDLMTNEILLPLNMLNTTFRSTANLDGDDVAKQYRKDFDGNFRMVSSTLSRHWAKLGASGSIISSAVDMAKWMIFHMGNGENADGLPILEPDMLQELHEPIAIYNADINPYTSRPVIPTTYAFTRYGMAWKIGNYRGFPMVAHTGTSWGYVALLTLLPSEQIGIYTALNSRDVGYFFRTALHMHIADILLNEQPWLNSSTACTFPEPWSQAPDPSGNIPYRTDIAPGRSLQVYTGTYYHAAYGNLSVVHNVTADRLQMMFGIGVWDLLPRLTLDNFAAQGTGDVWPSRMSTLKFQYDGVFVTELVATSFQKNAPPTFVRVA